MAFIEKKDPVVLNIKLTTKGRELLSTGNLTFKYFAIGDSEIDYEFNNETGLVPFDSKILRPADNNPNLISFIPRSISGDPYNEIPTIPSSWYLVTNSVESIGFFTSGCTSFITDSNHVKQPDVMILMSNITGGTGLYLKKAPLYGRSAEEPAIGDLILIKWAVNINTTGDTLNKTNPTPYLIYRISTKSGTLAANNLFVTVDRPLPNFTGIAGAGIYAGALIYYNFINYSGSTIFNDFSTDYIDESVLSFFQNSQCPTIVFPFWNMSIIFTEEIAGVQASLLGDKTFGQFDSRAYGGFVSYIQSQQPYYKKLGVIHYTNSSPANVYGEGFYLKTPLLEIPTIMWHKNNTATLGAKFKSGNGFTLTNLGIHYYDLVDVNDPTIIVGKIFDELKIFLIEDQELLFAMSYKSNRSWTLPEFIMGGGSGGNSPTPPTPSILFVQTIVGTPGSIKNTGGRNIIGYENVTEFGVEYKLTGATTWTRIVVGTSLAANNFNYTITGTTPNATYNYRSYVKIGNNEYIDNSTSYSITTLPTPVVPPVPPVIIPSVQTIIGTAGIGQIYNTGGNTIPANVFIAVEKYGMAYKLHSDGDIAQNWHLSPAVPLTGPLSVNNFVTTIVGLVESTSYDYRAFITVGGVTYSGITQTLTTLSSPPPTIFIPEVTTGIIFKQLSNTTTQLIDMLIRNNTIDDNGGTVITEYGLLYTQDPAKNNSSNLVYGGLGISKVSVIADITVGTSFIMTMPDLLGSSPIYFRLFAQNSAGIGYGEIGNGTTNPIVVPPATQTIFVCGTCQLSSNTDIRSCMCAHLGVSTPLLAGQNITLCFTDTAFSESNVALTHPIGACSWISCSPSTVCCNFVSSMVLSGGETTTCSQIKSNSININCTNINCYILHAITNSSTADIGQDFRNTASIDLTCALNSGGANYCVGAASSLVAIDTGPNGRGRVLPTE
ncbi:MAG: hypothetical protein WC428_00310 [Candidatus Paceibacterota bacterium]